MPDTTEDIRKALLLLGVPDYELQAVMDSGGQVWNTEQLREDFEVLGFAAPFVVVKRRADGQKGSLMFTHSPRFYYRFEATT